MSLMQWTLSSRGIMRGSTRTCVQNPVEALEDMSMTSELTSYILHIASYILPAQRDTWGYLSALFAKGDVEQAVVEVEYEETACQGGECLYPYVLRLLIEAWTDRIEQYVHLTSYLLYLTCYILRLTSYRWC